MKLKFLLIRFLFIFAICTSAEISAHTITPSLERTYIDTYLPIFFLAKLIPFIALGMLAYSDDAKGNILRSNFFVVLAIGIFTGVLIHIDLPIFLLNGIGVILAGIFLIYTKKTESSLTKYFILLFGLVLGFGYGKNFLHADNLWWFYILTLSIGCVFFIFLKKINFIGNPRLQIIINIASILIILSGIAMVLLS